MTKRGNPSVEKLVFDCKQIQQAQEVNKEEPVIKTGRMRWPRNDSKTVKRY